MSQLMFQVGLGRRIITPKQPMYLAGFAARDRPSEGVLHDLWTKAMAIEDADGGRVVLVTTDIIDITPEICESVAKKIHEKHGIGRKSIVFNVSHTHSGPFLYQPSMALTEMSDEHIQHVREYTEFFNQSLLAVIDEALSNLEPAQLWFGNDEAEFAVNRREPTPEGIINGYNPNGPSDYDVPVLKVTAPDGTLRAVLFGYACHTTSMTNAYYLFNGDYAGFAQINIEEKYPGAQAMFMMLCGADQNALPRGTIKQSQQYGAQLTAAVERALDKELQPLHGPIKTAWQTIALDFQPHTRATFEARLNDDDPWVRKHAKLMLQQYDEGKSLDHLSYPVQAVSFGPELTLLALGDEVVVDYVLRVKREFGSEGIIVAGYCNDNICYIPSLRVLREGGYEGGESAIYCGVPMPFTEAIEERIFASIHEVLVEVQAICLT